MAGQPTESTGGEYNPAAVRVRVKVGAQRALPGPGAGGGGRGPGGDEWWPPKHPLTGGFPYTTLGGGKPKGPVEIAQSIREAEVRDLYSRMDEMQKTITKLVNLVERRKRREGIYDENRKTARSYSYRTSDMSDMTDDYLYAEGKTEEEFRDERALAEKEINRQRREHWSMMSSAERRAVSTRQRAESRVKTEANIADRKEAEREFKERLRVEAAAEAGAQATHERQKANEQARMMREDKAERIKEFKDRVRTEEAAQRRAEQTFQKQTGAEAARVIAEGRKALEKEFRERLTMEGKATTRAERDRHKLSQSMERERRAEEAQADELMWQLALEGRYASALEGNEHLQAFAGKRLSGERKLRAVRTLTQRHAAYGAFFVASAQINPTQTISRIILNSLIRSGPVGAAIGTTAAIALSVEPVIRQTLKTFGAKGLPLNQDYHHFFSDQTVGFFTTEEQHRRKLGLDGVIPDPAFGYQPVPSTALYNSQQYATATRIAKLPDLERARRIV